MKIPITLTRDNVSNIEDDDKVTMKTFRLDHLSCLDFDLNFMLGRIELGR